LVTQLRQLKFENASPFRLGDIALVGNRDRLILGDDLECIYLETRVTFFRSLRVSIDRGYVKSRDLLSCWDSFIENKYTPKLSEIKEKEFTLGCKYHLNECVSDWETTMRKLLRLDEVLPTSWISSAELFPITTYCKGYWESLLQVQSFLESRSMLPIGTFKDDHDVIYQNDFRNVLSALQHNNLRLHSVLSLVLEYGNWEEMRLLDHYEMSCIIWISTISSARRVPKNIKNVVVDEAAMVPEAHMGGLFRFQLNKLVLVGDVMQLSAVVKSQVAVNQGYAISLFERLKNLNFSSILLDTQYRMHSDISSISRSIFYDDKVQDGFPIEDFPSKYERPWHKIPKCNPIMFVHLEGRQTSNPETHSLKNVLEIKAVKRAIMYLVKELKGMEGIDLSKKIEVGIISPYKEQCLGIFTALRSLSGNKTPASNRKSLFTLELGRLKISISSVDGFQGQERDIMIISTVRSNPHNNLGFVACPRRLNVAITRARFSCWIFGNSRTLQLGSNEWSKVIERIKKMQCFYAIASIPYGKSLVRDSLMIQLGTEKSPIQAKIAKSLQSAELSVSGGFWKINLSQQALDAIRKITMFDRAILVTSIMQLAEGKFGPQYYNDMVSDKVESLIRVRKAGEYVMLWGPALRSIAENNVLQILKIWGVYHHTALEKGKKIAFEALHSFSEEYLRCCMQVERSEVYMPQQLPGKFKFYNARQCPRIENADFSISSPEKHALINSHPTNQIILDMLAKESTDELQNLDLFCEMTPEEKSLIANQTTVFCLGRSGTGKTTVMLTKVWVQAYKLLSSGVEDIKLNQIMLTLSPTLAEQLTLQWRNQEKLLPKSKSITGKSNVTIYSWLDFIGWLDNQLEFPFFQKEPQFRLQLKLNSLTNNLEPTTQLGKFKLHYNQVDFQLFQLTYFAELKRVAEKFDPAFLWNEFRHVIKGGLQALQSPDGVMTLQEYVKLAARRNSFLDESDREEIYKTFQVY
jgi:hypothetical protein